VSGRRSDSGSRDAVRVISRPLWWIRISRELPRYVVGAAALTGLAASARFAIVPPHTQVVTESYGARPAQDLAAAGYATLFARTYLTWSAAEPDASAQTLRPFLGGSMESAAGLVVPPVGEQRVQWLEVVQSREPAPGRHVYTIAARTDSDGLVYLTVGVERSASGALALTGYPAFVGPPASAPAQIQAHLREVGDMTLATVVTRALRNFLAGSASELAADLTPNARVSVPTVALALQAVQSIDWTPDGRSVLVAAQARDGRGAQYTLDYELDVAREQGRWEVSAVQTDPYE
jgi:Conjugative transposon protein TcpC